MKLSPIMQKFILHWGEMGSKWGVNRTVAQIHALLYISEKPLNAEEIAETLQVARSHVSNSLRELQSWGLVKLVHVFGDRRDHFESMKDVWEMFRVVLDGRKRREVDPTIAVLRECLTEADGEKPVNTYTQERLLGLLDFFETMMSCYEQVSRVPTDAMVKLVKLGDWVQKLVGMASRE